MLFGLDVPDTTISFCCSVKAATDYKQMSMSLFQQISFTKTVYPRHPQAIALLIFFLHRLIIPVIEQH